jgi:sugar/nucleoside kinase (ribokinase family)
MCASNQYDVVYIGNYTKDTIITPLGTTYVDGGAVNYAAHAGARLGCRVAVVTRLAQEDRRVVDRLTESGVDCFVTYTPQSTLMRLEYPTLDPDKRTLSVAATAGTITAADLKGIRARAAVVGSSLRGEISADVIPFLKQQGMSVAADMQGYVRVLRGQELRYEPWEEMDDTLADINILKSDAVEAEFLTGESDIYKAAQFYAERGPREILLTHRDGLLVYADGQFHELGFYSARLDGRSGRGDTCLGAYAAMRLRKTPLEAGIWAAAVTSLKMETLGPFNRPIADVEALIQANYDRRPSSR